MWASHGQPFELVAGLEVARGLFKCNRGTGDVHEIFDFLAEASDGVSTESKPELGRAF